MLRLALVIIIVGFVAYALVTQYNKTPSEDSVPKRVWTSLVAAGTALGALVSSWFHSGTTP